MGPEMGLAQCIQRAGLRNESDGAFFGACGGEGGVKVRVGVGGAEAVGPEKRHAVLGADRSDFFLQFVSRLAGFPETGGDNNDGAHFFLSALLQNVERRGCGDGDDGKVYRIRHFHNRPVRGQSQDVWLFERHRKNFSSRAVLEIENQRIPYFRPVVRCANDGD